MIKAAMVALSLLAQPAVSQPPEEGRVDNQARVFFLHPIVVNRLCNEATGSSGTIACASIGGPWMIVPNPCVFADRELYAAILCHELGHINGFDHDDYERPTPPPVITRIPVK